MNQDDKDQAAWAASFPKPPTLNARELSARLVAAGIPVECVQIYDNCYRMLTVEYMQGSLADAFQDFLLKWGINWTEDNFDCNAFAMTAALGAKLSWAADKRGKQEGSSTALGVIGVPSHMFCVAVHNEGVKFYEPQPSVPGSNRVFALRSMLEVHPTAELLSACTSCIFI